MYCNCRYYSAHDLAYSYGDASKVSVNEPLDSSVFHLLGTGSLNEIQEGVFRICVEGGTQLGHEE